MRRHLPFSKGFTPMLHKLSVGTADACSRSPNLTPCSENLDSTYGVRTPRPDFPARAATFGLLEHSDSKVYATLGFMKSYRLKRKRLRGLRTAQVLEKILAKAS